MIQAVGDKGDSKGEAARRLINHAIGCYEAAFALRDLKCGSESRAHLEESVRAAIDADLAVRELTAGSDEDRIREWAKIQNKAGAAANRDVDTAREVLLSTAPVTDELISRWCRLLAGRRAELAMRLRGGLASRAQQAWYRRRVRSQWSGGIAFVAGLVLLGVALLGVYRYKEPVYTFTDSAQVFWKAPQKPWSEHASFRRPVTYDGDMKEIVFTLPRAHTMTRFRFDPVRRNQVMVAIDEITLLDTAGAPVAHHDFTTETHGWRAKNSDDHGLVEGIWEVESNGYDPHVISPAFPATRVKAARIRTRVRHRMSLKDWLLGRALAH